MILASDEIQRLQGDDIVLDPFEPDQLNANSYDLTLHNELLVYEEIILDSAKPNRYRRLEIPVEGLILQPNFLYLGRTVEYTETRGLVPMLKGRSSLSRLGLFVNPGGSLGHCGYCGTWTLEMHCVQPVKIYPGVRVCQIYYSQLAGDCEDYNTNDKYQNSRDIQPSLLYRELGCDESDAQLELNFDSTVAER